MLNSTASDEEDVENEIVYVRDQAKVNPRFATDIDVDDVADASKSEATVKRENWIWTF